MVPNYPYFVLPNYMRYFNYPKSTPVFHSTIHSPKVSPTTTKFQAPAPSKKSPEFKENVSNTKKASEESTPLFSILGIKLYFDDLLILCIIFFLYSENVNDPYLFFALVLLLMN